jgi:hypothetical protein
VKELIARAVQAKGGLEKLRSIRTVKVVGSTAVLDGERRVEVRTTISIRYPGAFRVDAETPAGPVAQVFSGGEYWIHDARGTRTAPPQVAEDIRGNVQRDAVSLLLALSSGRVAVKRLPDERDAGRVLPALEASGAGMAPVVLVLDPETSLIRKERYRANGTTVEEEYSDYRSVNGVQVAFRATVRRDGAALLERVLQTVEMNVPLAASLFSKPVAS